MPRRVGKNVFDVTRTDHADQPTQEPPPALGGLLPRLGDATVSTLATPPSRQFPQQGVADSRQDESGPSAAPRPNKPRGIGGRPAVEARDEGRITPVAARVPAALYAASLPLVKGVGRPSWGQLVTWTCQDDPAEVSSAVTSLAETAATPRRLRGQNREGEATMQITARLLPAELAAIDDLRQALDAAVGTPVTRTMTIVAALTVATHRADRARQRKG